MPYKSNETRRHKIPTAKYRVTNWPEYDAALAKRGSLTVWITEEAVAARQAPATVSQTWCANPLARRYAQMFSTGFNSGA